MFSENTILNDTYQVVREIGTGGISGVYLAYHLRLQKYVVIKRIKEGYVENTLLRKEVDTLKSLRHSNIPQVYDFIQDGQSVYTVMDYVEGYNLSEFIRTGTRCTQEQAIRWIRQIAEVLYYIHTRPTPVYHCDIKPDNIIITPQNDAVLIDFNISLSKDDPAPLGLSMMYASPEQAEAVSHALVREPQTVSIDGRSDIYSLGATFYHILSGIAPWPLQPLAPLTPANAAYSEGLLELINSMTSFQRERRPASAKKLLLAINRLESAERRSLRLLLCRCAGILLSAVLLGSGIYCIFHGMRLQTDERFMNAYTLVCNAFSDGDTEETERLCYELLNNPEYRQASEAHPEEIGSVFYALGEIAYQQADYDTAAAYYEQAAEKQSDPTNSWMNAAISYAEAGNLLRAERTIGKLGTDSPSVRLTKVVLAAKRGDQAGCVSEAESLLQESSDGDLCVRACLAAASVQTDAEAALHWLDRTADYRVGRTLKRGIAMAYLNLAQAHGEEAAGQTALTSALTCYQNLSDERYATKYDRLNYVTALRTAGRSGDAVQVIEGLLQEYPEDYLVQMNAAFVYYEANDLEKSRRSCEAALRLYKQDTNQETDKNVQDLQELANRLGIQEDRS